MRRLCEWTILAENDWPYAGRSLTPVIWSAALPVETRMLHRRNAHVPTVRQNERPSSRATEQYHIEPRSGNLDDGTLALPENSDRRRQTELSCPTQTLSRTTANLHLRAN